MSKSPEEPTPGGDGSGDNATDESLQPARIKRRKVEDLEPHEIWNCPLHCGRKYKRTSSASIRRHTVACFQATQQRMSLLWGRSPSICEAPLIYPCCGAPISLNKLHLIGKHMLRCRYRFHKGKEIPRDLETMFDIQSLLTNRRQNPGSPMSPQAYLNRMMGSNSVNHPRLTAQPTSNNQIVTDTSVTNSATPKNKNSDTNTTNNNRLDNNPNTNSNNSSNNNKKMFLTRLDSKHPFSNLPTPQSTQRQQHFNPSANSQLTGVQQVQQALTSNSAISRSSNNNTNINSSLNNNVFRVENKSINVNSSPNTAISIVDQTNTPYFENKVHTSSSITDLFASPPTPTSTLPFATTATDLPNNQTDHKLSDNPQQVHQQVGNMSSLPTQLLAPNLQQSFLAPTSNDGDNKHARCNSATATDATMTQASAANQFHYVQQHLQHQVRERVRLRQYQLRLWYEQQFHMRQALNQQQQLQHLQHVKYIQELQQNQKKLLQQNQRRRKELLEQKGPQEETPPQQQQQESKQQQQQQQQQPATRTTLSKHQLPHAVFDDDTSTNTDLNVSLSRKRLHSEMDSSDRLVD